MTAQSSTQALRETEVVGGGQRPVAFYDSGIGGLPYLMTAREALPRESFVYLGDKAGFPYGTKTHEEVRDIVVGLVTKLVRTYDPKAVVIACNTASLAGLDSARRANPGLPIIGTVPAVKPAAERTTSGVIAILATAGAIEDPYLDSLIARYAKGIEVLRVAAQSLVDFVERRAADAGVDERMEAVAPFVLPLIRRGVDKIVLACTHYLHLREEIATVAGPGIEIIDSRAGVVHRLSEVLAERGILSSGGVGSSERGLFLLTGGGPFEEEYRRLAGSFGLGYPKPFGSH